MGDAIRPDHYTPGPYEAIHVMRAWMTSEEYRGFLLGNVIKYTSRCGKKGSAAQDARKARQYLDWLIEALDNDLPAPTPENA